MTTEESSMRFRKFNRVCIFQQQEHEFIGLHRTRSQQETVKNVGINRHSLHHQFRQGNRAASIAIHMIQSITACQWECTVNVFQPLPGTFRRGGGAEEEGTVNFLVVERSSAILFSNVSERNPVESQLLDPSQWRRVTSANALVCSSVRLGK